MQFACHRSLSYEITEVTIHLYRRQTFFRHTIGRRPKTIAMMIRFSTFFAALTSHMFNVGLSVDCTTPTVQIDTGASNSQKHNAVHQCIIANNASCTILSHHLQFCQTCSYQVFTRFARGESWLNIHFCSFLYDLPAILDDGNCIALDQETRVNITCTLPEGWKHATDFTMQVHCSGMCTWRRLRVHISVLLHRLN